MNTLKVAVMALGLGLVACTAEQTEEGEAPEVTVDPGQLPQYDVDPAQVEVGKDTTKVVTPDVDIKPANDTTPR